MRPIRLAKHTVSEPARPTGQPPVGRTRHDGRSNTELLQAAAGGEQAFTLFYRHNVDSILAYFWHRTRDHEVTSDLTSETFAVALEKLHTFDPTQGDGGQWLQGIATNLLKRFWRRNRSTVRAQHRLEVESINLVDEAVRELEAADAGLDGDRLRSALQRLPSKNRRAVHLRIVENLDYGEIADQLGCTPGAARVRVLRGLKRLQHEFDPPTQVEAI